MLASQVPSPRGAKERLALVQMKPVLAVTGVDEPYHISFAT